jgi:uncharacterized protein RhaS with RHS repeats
MFKAVNKQTESCISRDPLAEQGGLNLYAYVHNNPIKLIDPLGLIDIFIYGAGPTGPGWSNDDVTKMANARGTSPYGRSSKSEMKDAIRNAKKKCPDEPVNIIGYSRGAIAANELANQLADEGIGVDNLILIDPVTVSNFGRGEIDVSSNAANANVFYQTNGGPFVGNSGAAAPNVTNTDMTGSGSTHASIPGDVSGSVQNILGR